MPARQGFQYSPEAAREDIGYGAAQVVDSGVGKMIDADVKRRQLALAESEQAAKRQKEKEDKSKPSLVEHGKLLPAYMDVANRATKEYYEDYKNNSHTWDNATKMQKDADIKNYIQALKTASDMGFKKNESWDKSKKTRNAEGIERLFDPELYKGVDLGSIDFETDFKGINDWSQYASVDINKTVTDLTNIAGWNASKGKIEKFNPETNEYITTEWDKVDDKLAKEILTEKWQSLASDPDTYQNALDEIDGDSRLSDKEKTAYKEDMLSWYTRQDNINLLTKAISGKSIQEGKEEGKGYTWGWQDPKKYEFAYGTDSKRSSPIGRDKSATPDPLNPEDKFEEIGMARLDPSENKKINITDPNDPDKQKDLYVVPLALRRYEGDKNWTLVIEDYVPKMKDGKEVIENGNVVLEPKTREIPYVGTVQTDIKRNYGNFDPDVYMKEVVGKKEETTANNASRFSKTSEVKPTGAAQFTTKPASKTTKMMPGESINDSKKKVVSISGDDRRNMKPEDAKKIISSANYAYSSTKGDPIGKKYIEVLDSQYKSIAENGNEFHKESYKNSWSKRPKAIAEFYDSNNSKSKYYKSNPDQLLDDAGYEAIDKFENTMGNSKGKSMNKGDGYSKTQESKIKAFVESNIGMDVWKSIDDATKVQLYSFMFNHGTNDNVLKGLAQAINLK